MLQILHLLLIHHIQNGLEMLRILHSLLRQRQITTVVVLVNDEIT